MLNSKLGLPPGSADGNGVGGVVTLRTDHDRIGLSLVMSALPDALLPRARDTRLLVLLQAVSELRSAGMTNLCFVRMVLGPSAAI
jgi:hypothetical protein